MSAGTTSITRWVRALLRPAMCVAMCVVVAGSVASCGAGGDGETAPRVRLADADYAIEFQADNGGVLGIVAAGPLSESAGTDYSLASTVAIASLVDPVIDESQPLDDKFGRYLILPGRRIGPYGSVWFETRLDRIELDLADVAKLALETSADPGAATSGFISVCSRTGFGRISTSSPNVELVENGGCAVWSGDLASVPTGTIVTIDMGRQWFTLLPIVTFALSAAAIVWLLIAKGLRLPLARPLLAVFFCLALLMALVALGYWLDHSRRYSTYASQRFDTRWTLWRFGLAFIGLGLLSLILPRVRQRQPLDE